MFHQLNGWYMMVQTIPKWPKWGLHGTGCSRCSQVSCAIFRPQRSLPKSRSEPRPLLGIDKTWLPKMGIPSNSSWKIPQKGHENGVYHGIPRKFFVDVCLIGKMMIQQRMELGNLPFQSNPHAICETKTGTKKKHGPMHLPASEDVCHTFSTRARIQPWHLPAKASICWMMLDDWGRLIYGICSLHYMSILQQHFGTAPAPALISGLMPFTLTRPCWLPKASWKST